MGSLEKKAVILRAGQEFLSGRRLSATLMEACGHEDKARRRLSDGLGLDEETADCSEGEVSRNAEMEGRRGTKGREMEWGRMTGTSGKGRLASHERFECWGGGRGDK